jgi:hypothetical protein
MCTLVFYLFDFKWFNFCLFFCLHDYPVFYQNYLAKDDIKLHVFSLPPFSGPISLFLALGALHKTCYNRRAELHC